MELEELKFVMSTEAQGADTAQQKTTNAIQQVGKVFTTVRENVNKAATETKKAMDTITDQVSSAATAMSNRYNNMSLSALQGEFVKIEGSITKQQALVQQANQALEEYASWWDYIEKQGTATASTRSSDEQLAALAKSANDASAALAQLKTQQNEVATAINSKTAAASQVADMNTQLADTKQSGAQAKMGLDAVANGLSVVGRATGGVGTDIANIAMEVRYLKQAYTSTASTAGSAAATMTAAFGAVGIAITAVVMIVNAIAQAEEEAKKKATELREEISTLSSDQYGAALLIKEYEDLNAKINKTADDTQRMVDIRAELVEQYGFSAAAVDEEGRLLAGNLQLMKEQLAIQKELLLSKLDENQKNDEKEINDLINKRYELLTRLNDPEFGVSLDFGPSVSGEKVIQDSIKRWNRDLNKLDREIDASGAISDMMRKLVVQMQMEGKEISDDLQAVIADALKAAIKRAAQSNTEFTSDAAQEIFQSMVDAFNNIDALVDDVNIPSIQSIVDKMMADAVYVDPQVAADSITRLLDDLFSGADETAYARAAELRERILKGLASESETDEYDSLIQKMSAGIDQALDRLKYVPRDSELLRAFRKEVVLTSDDLRELAAAEEAAEMSLSDAAGKLRSAASAYENVNKAISEVADMKGAVKAIKDYTSGVDKSADAAKNAKAARSFLADQFGVEKDAVDGMLPSIEDDIALKETLALAEYQVALASAYAAQATIQSMVAQGNITEAQGARMVAALQNVINKMNELSGKSVSVDGTTISPSVSVPTVKSSGGGGSRTNKALQKQLDLISYKKSLDQLTTQEEIDNLERVLKKYAKTTADKRKLTEEIYALRRQKEQEDLEYREAMDQLTLREQVAALDKMIATYKAGTAARRELEQQRYEAARELERQEYDIKVYYGQVTLAEQEAYLKKLIASYKVGVDARIELEKELYDVQQSIKAQREDELSTLADAVIEAFRARYEAMREDEKDTLQSSIKAWEDWGDAQVKALQEQLDAIDAVAKAEDDAQVEADKRRKIAALEQTLAYEQDAYNRRKLAEQLATAQADLADWLKDKEREAQKAALQQQIDNVNKTVDDQTAALDEQISAVDDYYDQLTKDAALQAEAQRLIMQGSQDQILAMLQSYAADYNLTGKSLGEQWLSGFMGAVGSNIDTWFDGLIARFGAAQAQLAGAATAAADQYYAGRGGAGSVVTTTETTKIISPTIQITVIGSGTNGGMTPSERQEMIDDIVAAISSL